ncbi:MAG: tetratricopeptide repeat protein [Treponema sp.]|nr:tetratricopeptide repeat protein [Treponema sp.]
MKKNRFFVLGVPAFALAFILGLALTGCDNGSTTPVVDDSVTYTGTAEDSTYTLTISATARALAPAAGNYYKLVSVSGDVSKTSTGTVKEVSGSGSNLTFTLTPSKGGGTIKTTVSAAGITGFEVTGTVTWDNGEDLALPSEVQDAIGTANALLLKDDYDGAVKAYRDAYTTNPDNPEAIIYSALAELAAISVDPKLGDLMRNHLGVKSYPATMGALFSDDWMKDYSDGGGTSTVPELSVPEWFKSTKSYTDSLSSKAESYTTWTLVLAANLLNHNTSGLDLVFDDILTSVFGETFEAVSGRVQRLKAGDSITLDEALAEKFGLDEIFEGDAVISKTEMDVLLAGLRLVKASFEWLASYNWETDFSFLKYDDWKDYDGFLAQLKKADVNRLPFRNNFLKNQDAALLNKSKADYLASIEALIDAYDAIKDKKYIPQAAKDEWDSYLWIKDGLQKLKAAINATGKDARFWIPEGLPSGKEWPNKEDGAVFGIDMQKFFTANHFTLEKLVEHDGNTPRLYGFKDDKGTQLSSATGIETYNTVGFKVVLIQIKDLIPNAFDETETVYIHMPVDFGKALYELYH